MFQFSCPHCNALIRIDEKHRGKKGRCKACGEGLLVPAASEAADQFLADCLSDSYNTEEASQERQDKAAANTRQLERNAPSPKVAAKKSDTGGIAGCLGLILLAAAVTIMLYVNGGSPQNSVQVDSSPETQAQREQYIVDLKRMRIIQKVDMPGSLPHVWVDSGFYALAYDQKRAFMSVVAAYFYAKNPLHDPMVLYDGHTGKKIGSFSVATGAGLRLH